MPFTARVDPSTLPAGFTQTPDWGNDVFGDVVDSTGAALDHTFVFERVAFDDGFIPTESSVTDWISHWNVFDRASYNGLG